MKETLARLNPVSYFRRRIEARRARITAQAMPGLMRADAINRKILDAAVAAAEARGRQSVLDQELADFRARLAESFMNIGAEQALSGLTPPVPVP